KVGVGGLMGDSVEDLLAPTQPPVEVVGRSSGHHLVKARVDEVWADLEGLHREPATPERFEQADRDGRLADATRHPGDDEHAGLHETSTCDVEVDEPIPPGLPRRPVDGGTRLGRSPGSRIVLLPAPARLARQWLSRVSSPITVTGSRRIRTAFPGPPVGTLGASNGCTLAKSAAAGKGVLESRTRWSSHRVRCAACF